MKSRKPLEASIERSFCNYVKERGGLTKKLDLTGGWGASAWPDRLVVGPFGVQFYIEFKREGGKVTPLQEDMHRQLRKLGQKVFVFYNAKDAIAEYERQIDAATPSA